MSKARSVILLFVDGVGVGPRDPVTNPFARLTETRLGRFQDEVPDGAFGVVGIGGSSNVLGRHEAPGHARPAPDTLESVGTAGSGAGPGSFISPLPLPDGGFWKPLDARLGVPGLPQSATGQATILTGINAPRRVGRHVSAIPDRRVRELLEEDNLFRMLRRAGRRGTFANAYTPAYFARKRPHISSTTRSLMAADIPLRRLDDLTAGRALFHDYTNETLRKRGVRGDALGSRPAPFSAERGSSAGTDSAGSGAASLPAARSSAHGPARRLTNPHPVAAPLIAARSAEEAADILFGLAQEHDFTLHEHFLTDLAGHRGTDDERVAAARRIEGLVEHLAKGAASHDVLFLVVSDHGNLEDLGVRTHTMHPVPFLAWGPGAEKAVGIASDLTHVTPAILASLGV